MLLVACAIVLASRPAAAQTYADATGFYADLGLALGWNNLAGPLQPVDNGTMAGFFVGGGYRFNTWAAEVEFAWVGGGEVTNFAAAQRIRASLTSLGVAAKFFPLAIAPNLIPQWVQPHVTLGIGTGLAEQAPVTAFTFGSVSQTVLLTRVGLGVDVMFTKHWGTIVDGTYFVTNNDALKGVGVLKIGLLCRF
jgi:hypothetical protein